jgi:hypothetical protein
MKILLQNELPAEAQIQQLIDTVTDCVMSDSTAYEACCRSGRVMAAYDDQRLVALGRLVDGSTGPQQFQFTVLPDYKERDIDTYMRKLLML